MCFAFKCFEMFHDLYLVYDNEDLSLNFMQYFFGVITNFNLVFFYSCLTQFFQVFHKYQKNDFYATGEVSPDFYFISVFISYLLTCIHF